jgi:hypothetical protein
VRRRGRKVGALRGVVGLRELQLLRLPPRPDGTMASGEAMECDAGPAQPPLVVRLCERLAGGREVSDEPKNSGGGNGEVAASEALVPLTHPA